MAKKLPAVVAVKAKVPEPAKVKELAMEMATIAAVAKAKVPLRTKEQNPLLAKVLPRMKAKVRFQTKLKLLLLAKVAVAVQNPDQTQWNRQRAQNLTHQHLVLVQLQVPELLLAWVPEVPAHTVLTW